MTLPPGLFAGVIPREDVQLHVSLWLQIFMLDQTDEANFLRKLKEAGVKPLTVCGARVIDSGSIRRLLADGKGDQ
jgi:hypothetical protein